MPPRTLIHTSTQRDFSQSLFGSPRLTYSFLIILLLTSSALFTGCQTTRTGPRQDLARQALVEQSIAEIPGVELQNLHIYCLGQRTFLIGDVQSSDQANAILLAADRVSSEHTVEGYLPLQSTQTHKSGDVTAKTAIQKQLVDQLGIGVAHEIDVWVMAGQAILVGFGDYKQAQIAVNIAKSTPGIDGVTNFIVLPTLANN